MIYLIRVEYKDCTLLKIGYTEDNNYNRRIATYKLHNPKCEILYTIPEGTKKHEKSLHRMFKKFTYLDYGREWFYEDTSIYEFFRNNTTKEQLDVNLFKYSISTISYNRKSELHKLITLIVNRWLCLDSSDKTKLNNNYNRYKDIISECREEVGNFIYEDSDILLYLSNKYNIPLELQNQIQDFIDNKIQNSLEITNFLDEFNKKSIFRDKMRLLCESPLNDQERCIILDQIPLTYKNYYETLGSERCKALSYDITYISKEYSDLQFNKNDLKEEVYKVFSIGSRYSKLIIKKLFSNLYESLGYNKTPKANDLEEYFEIKECKVLNLETGKRDAGFEIIRKKE